MKKFSNIGSIHTLSYELKNLVINKDFLSHFDESEYISKDENELRHLFINGRCESVCRWISGIFNDVEFYLLYIDNDNYHLFMKQNDMFYDGYNYDGVNDINQLEYVKLHSCNKHYDVYYISTGEFDRDITKSILNDKN